MRRNHSNVESRSSQMARDWRWVRSAPQQEVQDLCVAVLRCDVEWRDPHEQRDEELAILHSAPPPEQLDAHYPLTARDNELLWHHPASPHNEALSSPTTNTNIGPSQLVATSARV
ncbi:hypothetical protein PF005_g25114 [Phytophthora fragariae]|uniref:Uncharacterized protein n=1 Tax=Phytophthora fragariae TaxID=53985 RepID=A0A6A3QGZ1_9STRA